MPVEAQQDGLDQPLTRTLEETHDTMQAQKAASLRRAVVGRATLRAWYLAEPPPSETPGLVTLAAAFQGQAELAHFEATFHGFLTSHEATGHLPASASVSGYATDDGQVRECLLRQIARRHKDSQTLKGLA